MAVDKEAICLSRVYSYYPKCNFPLFRIVMVLKMTLNIIYKITKWLLKVRQTRIILASKVEREATYHL